MSPSPASPTPAPDAHGPALFDHRPTHPHQSARRIRADQSAAEILAPLAHPPAVRVMGYGPEGFEERSFDKPENLEPLLAAIDEFLAKYPTTWIDIDGLANTELIARLGARFSLHALALEDVVHVHQRAKVEDYEDHVFLVARMIALTDDVLQTEQISFFLGRKFLLTFQQRPGDCLDPVRERLRRASGKIRFRGADYLAYALLDAVVDGYFPVAEKLAARLNDLDDEIEAGISLRTGTSLHQLRRDLLLVQRSIWPHREAINHFSHTAGEILADETRVFLRDCYDHTIQILEIVETYREMCADVRDVYMAGINLRLGEVMKFLTLISTFFIPLSFVASLYGMNFDSSPYNMPELHWRYGYVAVLVLMAVAASAMLAFFWRRGWLRR